MKWEDTVMTPVRLSEVIQYFPDWDLSRGNKFIEELCAYVGKAQAEISFKAGRDSFLDDAGNANIPLSEAYDKGRREVVEFVGRYLNPRFWAKDTNEPYYTIKKSEWQAKLKEWGIE